MHAGCSVLLNLTFDLTVLFYFPIYEMKLYATPSEDQFNHTIIILYSREMQVLQQLCYKNCLRVGLQKFCVIQV